MAFGLPDSARHYLNQHYPGYQLEPLKQGLNNRVWRIRHHGSELVLRLHKAEKQPNQTRRSAECWAWGKAAEAGLAPQLVYWCPRHSFSLCRYIDSMGKLIGLTHRLVALHQLPTDRLANIDYQQQINLQLSDAPLTAAEKAHWQSRLQEWVVQLDSSRLPGGFTHHDLNLDNLILAAGGVQFIDYEYVAIGHPLWDVAACEDALHRDNAGDLWRSYLNQRQLESDSRESMAWHAAQNLYHLSCWLWFLCVGVESEAAARHHSALNR